MTLDKKTPKILGISYLIQFVASLLSDPLYSAAIGSGDISENLTSIANNLMFMRTGIIVDLVTALGIVVMTVFLYAVLQKQNKTYALVALSFWLIEAIFLVISSIGSYALVPLSVEFVQAGSPSYYLAVGNMLMGFKEFAYAVHMMFFGLGGIIWYYLFYKSEYIPKRLALWALVLMPLMPVDVFLVLLGLGLDSLLRIAILFPLIAYLPYEGVIGLWFIFKGLKDTDSKTSSE